MSELKPVYLIYGDGYQVEEAIKRLKKRVGADGTGDTTGGADGTGDTAGGAALNIQEFDASGGQALASEIIQAAGTLPFFGETLLIIVRRADKLPKDDQKTLAGYVAAPSPATILVLTAGEKAAKTSELYKTVDAIKGAAEYKAPKGAELIAWVAGLLKEQGKRIDQHTAKHLIDIVGTDQSALFQEAQKLAVFTGDRETVAEQDVDDVATRNPESNIFEMVDALGHKQTDKALTELNRLLFNGEAPQRVLAMVVRQFRIIIKAKALEGQRMSAGEAAAILGVIPYHVDKYKRQAKSFTMPELKKIYGLLKDTDIDIKTGKQEPSLALEMLVGRIAG